MASILITGARAPVALHLARLMKAAGHRVLLADSLPRPVAAASRMQDGFHLLPSPRFQPDDFDNALRALLRTQAVDLVLPTCEEVFHLARLWQAEPPAARLYAPPLPLLAQAHDKYRFIQICAGLGLEVPATQVLTTLEEVQSLNLRSGDLVLKPVWSRFAVQVLIRPDARALARVVPTATAPWVAQEFLPGQEISAYALAQGGRLVGLSLYRGLYRAGRGASVAFAPVKDAAARDFVTRFVAGTGWTGQVSFDLMQMPDGRVLPLECNPRATSGLHFFRSPAGLAAAVMQGAEVTPDVERPQGVRLALWLYGLPAAVRAGRLAPFRQALREVEEVLDWPGDPGPRRAQGAALMAIAARALRQGTSLQRAATRDIEWNGPQEGGVPGAGYNSI